MTNKLAISASSIIQN